LYLSFILISLMIQTLGITLVNTALLADALALTIVPPMIAGALLGKRWGALTGVVSNLITLGEPLATDVAAPGNLLWAMLGLPVAVAAGAGFGYLRDRSWHPKPEDNRRESEMLRCQRLEEQLRQSQKMEVIGTLAGGMAHDMNNILGIIMSSASVLKANRPGDETDTDVETILSACRRGRDLTQNLLGFARKGVAAKQVINLNELVANSKRLLAPLMDKNLEMRTRLAPSLHNIYGDRSQIGQVLMNLCINASEAIRGPGTITVSTWNHLSKEARFSLRSLNHREFAVVRVQDTGQGMDRETLKRAFEPFFTTKQPGRGTGLGLSLAYRTVKNHGGTIEIESEPGKGTTITISLPVLDAREPEDPLPHHQAIPASRGSVLLVDDEPLILSSSRRLLKTLGYDVLVAESGQEAIDVYRSSRRPVHLVILDFVMPEMDGAQTFKQIKEINPNARVIISSGYSKDGKIESILKAGALGFIQKPFDLEQIARMLRDLPSKSDKK
jgi:two-component system, cell cycle sensor histidine kinase and response regulator CckA